MLETLPSGTALLFVRYSSAPGLPVYAVHGVQRNQHAGATKVQPEGPDPDRVQVTTHFLLL